MAILSIVQMKAGSYDYVGSCLRTRSNEVLAEEFKSSWLRRFISDMFETLYSHSSGVGLAANQVGMLKRICVVDVKRDGKKPMVLINPIYEPIGSGTVESKEVCLSFPFVSSTVNRYPKVRVSFQDYNGMQHTEDAEGFKALVYQHEIDHLNGIVHIDLCKEACEPEAYEGYSLRMANAALNKYMEGIITSDEGQ